LLLKVEMGKRRAPKDSSENIPNSGKNCTKKSLRGKQGRSKTDPRILNVIEDLIQSPIDDERVFRYLELKNGIKVILISDLSKCDRAESSDSEDEHGPGCRDPAIDQFNEDVLGFKKPPCCGCAEHHRHKPRKRPAVVNCRNCRAVSL